MSLHVFIVFLQVAGRSLLYGFTRVLRPGSCHLGRARDIRYHIRQHFNFTKTP